MTPSAEQGDDRQEPRPEPPAPHGGIRPAPRPNPWPEEFQDEEPGSYLVELSMGSVLASWAAMQLAATAALAAVGAWSTVERESPWFLLLRVLWLALPLSGLLALATILWHSLNSYTRRAPRRVAFATVATLISLTVWSICRATALEHQFFAPGSLNAPVP